MHGVVEFGYICDCVRPDNRSDVNEIVRDGVYPTTEIEIDNDE